LELRLRIKDYCSYAFHNSREIPSTIENLSMTLRCDVALHLYKDLVTAVPFFSGASRELLTDTILAMSSLTLAPGDVLYEKGDYGDCMYFLVGGSLEVMIDPKKKLKHVLSDGCYVGESSLMGYNERRPLTVRAKSWCNLFSLDQVAFKEIILQHAAEVAVVFGVGSLDDIKTARDGEVVETMGGGTKKAGDQPPFVQRTLAMMKSERKDEMDEVERFLQGGTTHHAHTRSAELGIGDSDAPGGNGDMFGSKEGARRSEIPMREEELLQDPAALKADYDLTRIKMKNDLFRLRTQLRSAFNA
jgi:hypothetical protein